jgi:WD40 repeat protein
MYDLMISYSRNDISFVQKLADILTAKGKEVWVDLKGIFYGEEWLERIFAAIEDSDNMIFVLSPDSIKSKYCIAEIKHALNHHKSILPILFRKITQIQRIPPYIRKLQWMNYDIDADINAAVKSIVEFVEENPGQKRYHGQLLNRARQWKKFGHDSSLIMGEDLAEATNWLKIFEKKFKMKSSSLEKEFIQASINKASQVSEMRSDLISNQILRDPNLDPELGVALSLATIKENRPNDKTILALTNHLKYVKTIALFDKHNKEAFDKEVHSVRIAPDERFAASAGGDGTVRIWGIATLQEKAVYDRHARNATGDPWAVMAADWSPDNQFIASGGKDGVMRIWHPFEIEDIAVLQKHNHWINDLRWSPDGNFIASCSRDGSLLIWDTQNWKPRKKFQFSEYSSMRALSWNNDGSRIAAVSDSGFIRILDPLGGKILLKRRLSNQDAVTSVDWHGITDLIVTFANMIKDEKAAVHILNPKDLTDVQKYNFKKEYIRKVKWSKNGEQFAAGTNQGRVYVCRALEKPEEQILVGHKSEISSMAWLENDTKLVTSSEDTTVRIWTLEEEQKSQVIAKRSKIVAEVGWTSDGNRLLVGGYDGRIDVLDADDFKKLRTMRPYPKNHIHHWALSPDGSKILIGADCRIARLWDVNFGTQVREFKTFKDWTNGVAWCPRNRYIAVGDCDIRIYEAQNFQQVKILKGHEDALETVDWSPNGRFLASTGLDMLLIVWDMDRMEMLWKIECHDDKAFALEWSPDSNYVITGGKDHTAKVWHIVDERPVSIFLDHDAPIYCAKWAPNGRLVATGSGDSTIRIWNPSTGEGLLALTVKEGPVHSICWDQTGNRLISGSEEGSVRLWELVVEKEKLVAIAKSRIVKSLTEKERSDFGLLKEFH